MSVIDAVLSYHADGLSCGVTRFSQQLARRLGVPWGTFGTHATHPLLSLKLSEAPSLAALPHDSYDLFLHQPAPYGLLKPARRIFAASGVIASETWRYRPDVIRAWCPSLVEAHPLEPIKVLSFGMAHKLRTDLYALLKEQLDATGEPYVVYVSAALHDGTSFSDAAQSFETLRALFGPSFVFLGTLSDEAMVERLRTCTYFAAFFDPALRENNTSVMAALEAGATVLTNCDSDTSSLLSELVINLQTGDLPRSVQQRKARARYGWEPLVELIRAA